MIRVRPFWRRAILFPRLWRDHYRIVRPWSTRRDAIVVSGRLAFSILRVSPQTRHSD